MALPSRRSKEPPIRGPVPQSLELVIADLIYVPKDPLPAALRTRLARLAAFQNPEFYRAQAMRLPTFGKPRILHCGEETSQYLALPRGCLEEIRALLARVGIKAVLRDQRFGGELLSVKFRGELRPDQQLAAKAMVAFDTGVLAATTAFGKTVLAAWLIANRGVNTLILVHRQQLLEQWVDRLCTFLDINPSDIGRLGGGRKKLGGKLDIALIESLVRKGVVNDCVASYGHLVIDECHHLPAASFELVARRAKARFVAGLSATVARKYGHHPIIFMQCGPVRFQASAIRAATLRPFGHTVIVRPTGFRAIDEAESDARAEFQRLYEALIESTQRNGLICSDVIAAVKAGRFPLVITERTEHLTRISNAFCLDSERNHVAGRNESESNQGRIGQTRWIIARLRPRGYRQVHWRRFR